MRRFYGGEIDGNSRQLARFIYSSTKIYTWNEAKYDLQIRPFW
jgi:hypothetical protein